MGHFSTEELVCRHAYRKLGEDARRLVDHRLIEVLEALRERILCAPITINDRHLGGTLTQRGLRCNLCGIVKNRTDIGVAYLSAHVLGKAADCTVKGMTAEEARQLIAEKAYLLPHAVRIEEGTDWLHIDVATAEGADKITYFKG